MKSLIHKPLSLITKTRIRGLDAFSCRVVSHLRVIFHLNYEVLETKFSSMCLLTFLALGNEVQLCKDMTLLPRFRGGWMWIATLLQQIGQFVPVPNDYLSWFWNRDSAAWRLLSRVVEPGQNVPRAKKSLPPTGFKSKTYYLTHGFLANSPK